MLLCVQTREEAGEEEDDEGTLEQEEEQWRDEHGTEAEAAAAQQSEVSQAECVLDNPGQVMQGWSHRNVWKSLISRQYWSLHLQSSVK